MNIGLAMAFVQAALAAEPLPVDERMAAYEAVTPQLREAEARVQTGIDRLGHAEPDWETSALSAESAITAGQGNIAEHVLGEWDLGGHGVVVAGDRPFATPQGVRRYSVRDYTGRIDFHSYNRAAPGIVLHTFGAISRIGNAECQIARGIEVISRGPWQEWPPEAAPAIFFTARMTRDDERTYCTLYHPTGSNRFSQLAYAPTGQPYVAVNQEPQCSS